MTATKSYKKAVRRVILDARRYIDDGQESYSAWQKAMDDFKGASIDVDAYVHDIERESAKYQQAAKSGDTKELLIAGGIIVAALVGIKKLLWHRLKRYGISERNLQASIERTESKLRKKEYADIPSLLGKLTKFKVSLKDKVRAIAQSIKTGISNFGSAIKGKWSSAFGDSACFSVRHNDIVLAALIGPIIGAGLSGLASLVGSAYTFRAGNTKQEALNEIEKAKKELKSEHKLIPEVAINAFAKACKAVVKLMPENKDKINQIYGKVYGQYNKMKALPREDSACFVDRIVHDAMYRRKKMCHYALQGVTRRDSIGATKFIIDSYAKRNLLQLLKPVRGLSSQQTKILNRRIDAAILRKLDSVIYSRSMRKDFLASAAMFAVSNLLVPLLVRIISAPIVKVLEAPGAALQSSIKANLTDPVTSKIKGQAESIVGKLKQILASRGKDETAIGALWRGVRPELDKLIASLKREGGNLGKSILGALKAGVDKVSKIFSKRDSRYALCY